MTIRVGAIQAAGHLISYREESAARALDQVREHVAHLVDLVDRAADRGCAIAALPEDCLGTLEWEAGHWEQAGDLLRPAEEEMLSRLGEAAARRGIYLVCCNDCAEAGNVYNTAILLDRNGREIGRYRKVHPTLGESLRVRGTSFPVFDLPGIGTVGLCICYDIMFPETTRALALAGADIVFHSTLGGASLASSEASLAAFRTRAVENYVYLVVAFRGGGSMIVNPHGEIVAEGRREPDAIVTADIDPASGRTAGDALGGETVDFRARLFRERNPAAYGVLLEEHPPVLDKLRHVAVPSVGEAAALFAEAMTTGADAFYEAERWLEEGLAARAGERFTELAEHFGTVWIGRAARERLARMASSGSDAEGGS